MESRDTTPAATERTPGPWRRLGMAGKPLLLLALLLVGAWAVNGPLAARLAGWLERGEPTNEAALAAAQRHVAAFAAADDTIVLAAEATQEGHWRFVNRAGETLTVGTPDEMARAGQILMPRAKPAAPLLLFITQQTLLDRRSALKDLPKGTQLRVVVRDAAYAVLPAGEVTAERLYIEVRPRVLVEARGLGAVREAMWQLTRPMERARVRVLALEPGGPVTLPPVPRRDPVTARALIDSIDPESLVAAMGSVRGQTLVVTGRAERGVLYVQPSRGGERGLLLRDLAAGAEAADVNLVILLSASTPRQPGGRNWFWQKVEVKGLDLGLEKPTFADFLDAVGASSGRLLMTVKPALGTRTVIEALPAGELPSPALSRGLGEVLLDSVADLTGRVVVTAVLGDVRNADRQRELDRRIVPWLPSTVQAAYAALLVLGLLGLPAARTWWAGIWPAETRADYANAVGFRAAQAVRGAVFLVLFMPLVAPLAAPKTLLDVLAGKKRSA